MTTHATGTRKEWLTARLALLEEEKELTRRSDELAQQRQGLPWVRVDKAYRFETDEGAASLPDLFRGRSQMLIYHFMFGPDYKAGCPSCSAIADGFNGFAVHLANHDVMLWAVSRAPLAKLQAYKRRMGWTFPWASSFGGDFNADWSVWFTEEQQRSGIEYNYHREPAWQPRPEDSDNGPAVFAAIFLRERPTRRQLAGMALAFGGLVLIAATTGQDLVALGFALTLGSAVSWGIGNIVVKRMRAVPQLQLMVWLSLVVPLPALAVSVLVDGADSFRRAASGAPWSGWAASPRASTRTTCASGCRRWRRGR